MSPDQIKIGDRLFYRTIGRRVTVVGGPQSALDTTCFLVEPDGERGRPPYLAPCGKLGNRAVQTKRAKCAKTPTLKKLKSNPSD